MNDAAAAFKGNDPVHTKLRRLLQNKLKLFAPDQCHGKRNIHRQLTLHWIGLQNLCLEAAAVNIGIRKVGIAMINKPHRFMVQLKDITGMVGLSHGKGIDASDGQRLFTEKLLHVQFLDSFRSSSSW